MNNFEWDQAKGELGSESIGCYQSTDLQCDERSQVWGYKVPSKPDLSTVREQQSNVHNRRHKNNCITATIGHSAQ